MEEGARALVLFYAAAERLGVGIGSARKTCAPLQHHRTTTAGGAHTGNGPPAGVCGTFQGLLQKMSSLEKELAEAGFSAGGSGGASGGGGAGGAQDQQRQAEMEAARSAMLKQILTPEAKERRACTPWLSFPILHLSWHALCAAPLFSLHSAPPLLPCAPSSAPVLRRPWQLSGCAWSSPTMRAR